MMEKIIQILLWISVIAWSLWFGGLIYETVVIMPLWSASLPESVIEWNSRPNFIVNPSRFFVPVALTTVLSSLLALIFGWKLSNRRFWLVLSAVCAASALAFTLIYFFAKNDVLFRSQFAGLSGEEITAIGNAWIAGNWVRAGIMAIGFFAALRAYNAKTPERI
jgi:hypothetical protein